MLDSKRRWTRYCAISRDQRNKIFPGAGRRPDQPPGRIAPARDDKGTAPPPASLELSGGKNAPRSKAMNAKATRPEERRDRADRAVLHNVSTAHATSPMLVASRQYPLLDPGGAPLRKTSDSPPSLPWASRNHQPPWSATDLEHQLTVSYSNRAGLLMHTILGSIWWCWTPIDSTYFADAACDAETSQVTAIPAAARHYRHPHQRVPTRPP